MQPVYHLQYFFIVVPCGCTYPKILFYLPKKEVRSVCNQYTIFNIFLLWFHVGVLIQNYCFTYPRKRFEVHATSIPSSIFFLLWFHVSVLIQKNCFTYPRKRFEVHATCIPSSIFFFIVVPCGCTYPKILFYLSKKEVRSVCNQYTIFNIFLLWFHVGALIQKYCLLTQERGSKWVHPKFNTILL